MSYNVQEIKNKIETLRTENPNVTSVGYGYKITNGESTSELSIIFSVKEKKPLSELSPEEVIPSEINLTEGTIKTDVIVIDEVNALLCNPTCGQNAGSNSVANRSYTRPLQGGLSMTSKNNVTTVGTLGFIGVETSKQALVGVTNNHVIINDAFYTSDRNLLGLVQNDYTPVNEIYQDGETGTIPPSSYIIGKSVRYVPIYEQGSGTNYSDVAIFSIDEVDIDLATSFKQIGDSYNFPLPFATTSEIDNLLLTNPMLYSSGRTTGPKGGGSCPMRVLQLGVSLSIGYVKQGMYVIADFADSIAFVKPETDPNTAIICSNPILPGDSGSALIADFDGVRKIIGLVYAAGQVGGTFFYGYACRIDRVAQEIGIEAWDGLGKNYIDPNSIEYITTPGGSSTKIINCNSKDYWQAGLTTLNNVCI